MIKVKVKDFEKNVVRLLRLIAAKHKSQAIYKYPLEYASILLGKEPFLVESQVFNFHLANKTIQFNFNYLEENQILKNAIKLSLPSVQVKTSFYIDYENSYMTIEKYREMKDKGFAISDGYFQHLKSNQLKILSAKEKTAYKKNRLKITLVNDQRVEQRPNMKTIDLIPEPSDILIFITGGGFIADFEKVAQYYLRESFY